LLSIQRAQCNTLLTCLQIEFNSGVIVLIKALLILFVTFSYAYAYVDLGIVGKTYRITERPLIDVIAERTADINWTKEINSFYADLDKQYTYDLDLPQCQKTTKTERKNEFIVPYDVPDDNGKLIFRAGQVLTQKLPKGQTYSVCFLDGKRNAQAQLRAVDKAELDCELVVANADSRAFSQTIGRKVAPMHKLYLTRIDIDCFPSAARFIDDVIEHYSFETNKEKE
jgi:hypothetical protein